MSLAKMATLPEFEFITSEGYLTLKLSGAPAPETVKEFEDALAKAITSDPPNVIVNCADLSELGKPWLRVLVQLSLKLKAVNRRIRMVGVTREVKLQLTQNGVDQVLPTSAGVRQALVDFGLVTPKALDVNFINPFLAGTINVLKVQAQVDATPGKIFQKDASDKFHGDISGVIGLISEAFTGSVVISFPKATFLAIMSKMLGENYTEITKEIEDGAGEFTNIIFGQAKVTLNERGYGIKTAIPSVISGKDHTVTHIAQGPRVVVPFQTPVGEFFIEICINR